MMTALGRMCRLLRKDSSFVLTKLPQKLTGLTTQTRKHLLQNRKFFGARLSCILTKLGVKQIELVRRLKGQYPHCAVSESLVSRWISGKRDASAYLAELASVLKEDLIQELSIAQAAQEIKDWYALLGADHLLRKADFEGWFPKVSPVSIAGQIPRLKLPDAYQRRPRVRDEIIARLLNIEPSTGTLRQSQVALVGLPGSGKSSIILEVLEKTHPFFQGGILYGDLGLQSPREILDQWCQVLQIDCQGTQPLSLLAEQLSEVLGEHGGRWLVILENVADSCRLPELVLPGTWALITAYGIPPFQPLGWEQQIFPIPSFEESETVALLKHRLGDQWHWHTCTPKAKELHRLVEGLPMGVYVLAAVIRSRGWDFVLERLRDRERAVSVIQYDRGQTPCTSLARAIDLALGNLSEQAHKVLAALSFLTPGESFPEAFLEYLFGPDSCEHGEFDVEAAQHELMEHLILEKFADVHDPTTKYLRLHRLTGLQAAQGLPLREKTSYRFNVVENLCSPLISAHIRLLPRQDVVAQFRSSRTTWVQIQEIWKHAGVLSHQSGPGRVNLLGLLNDSVDMSDCLEKWPYCYLGLGTYLGWSVGGPKTAFDWRQRFDGIVSPDRLPEMLHLDTLMIWADVVLENGPSQCLGQALSSQLEAHVEKDAVQQMRLRSRLARLVLHQNQPERASAMLTAHPGMGWEALIAKLSEHDHRSLFEVDERNMLAFAEMFFAYGLVYSTIREWKLASIAYRHAIYLAITHIELRQPWMSDPMVPSPSGEATGSYPALWLLRHIFVHLTKAINGLRSYELGYDLYHAAAPLILSVPWLYSLDYLLDWCPFVFLTQGEGNRQSLLEAIRRGEKALGQTDCRSRLAHALFHHLAGDSTRLPSVSRSLRRRKQPRLARQAEEWLAHFGETPSGYSEAGAEDFHTQFSSLILWVSERSDKLTTSKCSSSDGFLSGHIPW